MISEMWIPVIVGLCGIFAIWVIKQETREISEEDLTKLRRKLEYEKLKAEINEIKAGRGFSYKLKKFQDLYRKEATRYLDTVRGW